MSGEGDGGVNAGLVLGGGGARGAYTSGALSVLLPELKDQVRVIVGTSAGALIAAYLVANWHRSTRDAIKDGLDFWRELRFGDVFAPLVGFGGAGRFMRYVSEFLPVSSLHAPSVLNPEPLQRTLGRLVDFDRLSENISEQRVVLGVVATPAHSNSSVVFHNGGIPRHRDDPLRGIEYIATPKLRAEHILASSAIPALFPAVRVTTPAQAAGWYFDGGPRLNTPIKPALWLGAERVIVIALNAVASSRTAPLDIQPDFYVGAAHLLHAALGDPLAQDIRTLANRNALIAAAEYRDSGAGFAARQERRAQPGGVDEPVRPVPYIFIAPEDPSAIGEIARRVYRKHYSRPWKAGARDLWLLGKILDGSADAMHGELMSYLFFAGEFAEELIRLGQADACRWIDEHPADLWQLDPLPDWTQPRAAIQAPAPSVSRIERFLPLRLIDLLAAVDADLGEGDLKDQVTGLLGGLRVARTAWEEDGNVEADLDQLRAEAIRIAGLLPDAIEQRHDLRLAAAQLGVRSARAE
jgi:NTE family protein